MPIRPELRKFYTGSAWAQTRLRILTRAANRCEQCHVPNGHRVERGPHGVWRKLTAATGAAWTNSCGNKTTFEPIQSATRVVLIVLTIAHLNHKAGDDREENLKALCQWCHLNYDKLHHRETRCDRKDASRPLLGGHV